MARLYTHGSELLRLEYPSQSISYRSNRYMLVNKGWGWKRWKRWKAHVDPAEQASKHKARYDALSPEFHAYMQALSVYSLKNRVAIHAALVEAGGNPKAAVEDSWMPRIPYEDIERLAALRNAAEAAEQPRQNAGAN